MKKYISILSAILFCNIAFANNYDEELQQLKKFTEAKIRISSMYVDEVDGNKMIEDAIVGMLEQLDPHSVYIPKKEVAKMNEQLVGEFEGIGVQYTMVKDTLHVENTIAGGPSEKVGILPGDRIVFVNDTLIAGVKMPTTDIMKRLRGKKGTPVIVKVLRRGIPELIEFKIIRDKIPLLSIDATYMITPEIGYIKLSKFSETSEHEFSAALNKLKKEGMKKLIVDLKGNGGGYLQIAIEIIDEFLENGQQIVYTEGRRGNNQYTAKYFGAAEDIPLAILVDEYSASASEIFSGAVQDWDRGVIVGRRTYGKGLVQQPVMLPDGSMMRLTVARYHTPSGRCIQRPYKDGVQKYQEDVIRRYNHGELTSADSIHFPDSLRFVTMRNKRIVYGGGGIMPDYFVPLDTTITSSYLTKIYAKGLIHTFVTNWLEKNAKSCKAKYSNDDGFAANFEISETDLGPLIKMATDEKIEFDEKGYNKSKFLIKMQIKALIARRLYEPQSFYKVFNAEDEICKKAIEILQDDKLYQQLLQKE